MQENVRTEVKSNPVNCLFLKYNDRLTREVESAFRLTGAHVYYCPVVESCPWRITRLVCLRPIHPCAQKPFCSNPFKCLHIQGTVIYSKGPSHIWWCMTVFQFYSCWLTVCGWLCRLDGAVCVCGGEEVEQNWGGQAGVTVWNCYWQANGGGWGERGRETNRVELLTAEGEPHSEWHCLNRGKGSERSTYGQRDRRTDTHTIEVQCKSWHKFHVFLRIRQIFSYAVKLCQNGLPMIAELQQLSYLTSRLTENESVPIEKRFLLEFSNFSSKDFFSNVKTGWLCHMIGNQIPLGFWLLVK